MKNIDLSKPKRKYYSDKYNLTKCPECGSDLVENNCTILLYVITDSDEGEFMTNISGSHFCKMCPVVVFDTEKIAQAAKFGIRGAKSLRYIIGGIIDLDSIPDDKKHLEIGCDDNPVPLVQFLPDINNQTVLQKRNLDGMIPVYVAVEINSKNAVENDKMIAKKNLGGNIFTTHQ